MRLVGITSPCRERRGTIRRMLSPENANEVQDAIEFLNRPSVKAKLDADEATFGRRNPAAERLPTDHVPQWVRFGDSCQPQHALITLLPAAVFADRFRDNPEHPVDRASALWATPIGELQSKVVPSRFGTAFLVSPCYILTVAHVVYADDLTRTRGDDYSMWFRAGLSENSAFAGKTTATPALSGNRDTTGGNDWALMRLQSCVGGRPEFGWFERGQVQLEDMKDGPIIAVGFEAERERGTLSVGSGKVFQRNKINDRFETNAVMLPGQSGGPILSFESGKLVVAGMNVAEKGNVHGATYDHYTQTTQT